MLEDHLPVSFQATARRSGGPFRPGDADVIIQSQLSSAGARSRVPSTDSVPWRQICCLEIESPYGRYIGTGWLASPRTVITAGHSVFHRDRLGGFASLIHVSPGRNGAAFPFGRITATRFETVKGWIDRQEKGCDYAAIFLPEPLSGQVGALPAVALADHELEGKEINLSGYPLECLGEQWRAEGGISHVAGDRLYYAADTLGGQSGAPVFISSLMTDGSVETKVIAIHTYGIEETPEEFGQANSATRLTAQVLSNILRWVDG